MFFIINFLSFFKKNFLIICLIFLFFINFLFKLFYSKTFRKFKIFNYFLFNFIFFYLFLISVEIEKNLTIITRGIYIIIGNEKFNILSFFFSIFWILFTLILNVYNSYIFNFFFKNLKHLDLNFKILIFKIITLILFFTIFFAGFSFMNLNRFVLGVLGAALGISINTHVQKIINNYISGLIILFDKNFKIGDAVNVNGYQGIITQINNRYTILRNLDCSEILVPNDKFLNDVVQNQSLYFSKGNLRINIQVSHNNNYKIVLELLLISLKGLERILNSPPPLAYVTLVSITGIDVELSFWVLDAVRGIAIIKSDVYLNILKNFKNNNIELSYYKKILKIL